MSFFGSLRLGGLFIALCVTALLFGCVSIYLIYINASMERRSEHGRTYTYRPLVCIGLYKPRTGHIGRTIQFKNHAPAILADRCESITLHTKLSTPATDQRNQNPRTGRHDDWNAGVFYI